MYFSSFVLFNSQYGKKSYLERQILQEKRKLKKKRALTSSSIIKKKKKKKKKANCNLIQKLCAVTNTL